MGKHSAPRARTITPAATTPTTHDGSATAPRTPATPRGPVPAVLAQTAAFGALAIVVAVIALTWAGIGGREAALVGIALLVLGVIAFFVVRRSGLLADPSPAAQPAAGTEERPSPDPHL